MDTPFAKGKRKRQRNFSDEANSFMRNVTSSVSGLLPVSITKWFSNNETNANGSAPKADATDSSSDDETSENSVVVPVKRKRLSSPNISNNINTRGINSESSDAFGARAFVVDREIVKRDTNFASPLNKINEDKFGSKEKEVDNSKFKARHTISKRKSLFDAREISVESIAANVSLKPSNNVQSDIKQPYFNPVLLGSPFYPGMTMYGGASSCYMNTPNIIRRKIEVNKQDKNNETCMMSVSTRRVLDLLEHYSSPVTEAKRIPQYTKTNTTEKVNDSVVNTSSRNYYKYRELQIPRFLEVVRMSKKSRLTNVTNTARQILASQSSSDPTQYPILDNTEDDKRGRGELTTKIKRKLTRSHLGNDNKFVEPLPAVELPSCPLKIDSAKMPTFSLESSFSIPIKSTSTPFSTLSSSISGNSSTTSSSVKVPSIKDDITAIKVADKAFKFANPIKVNCEIAENTSQHENNSSTSQFTFGSSDKQVNNREKEEKIIEAPLEDALKTTDNSKADWECPDCWVKNKNDIEKCVCCGGKPGNKSLKSTHNKIDESQSNNTKNNSSLTVTGIATSSNSLNNQLQKTSQWKCQDCWVGNDNEVDKCVCCGASKHKDSSSIKDKINLSMEKEKKCDYSGFFKSNVSDKSVSGDDTKIESNNLKSTLKIPVTSNEPKNNRSFQEIAKSQKSNSWECHLCLVTNPNNLSRCQCCDIQRGLSKGPKVNFKFGINNTFKFGSALKEASLDKSTEVKVVGEDKTKVINNEATNNNLAKIPSFSFNLPIKKQKDNLEFASSKTEEPKLSFKFGISQQINTDKIKSDKKKSENLPEVSKVVETDEKLQEVPSVNILKPKTSFNSMSEIVPGTGKDTTLGSMTKSTNDAVEKDTSSKVPIIQPTSLPSTETVQPLHNFMFSTLDKPSTGFFSAVPTTTIAPTTAATISFTSIKPKTPETIKAPELVFQNTVTTATTSNTFSFGTNTTQNNVNIEKPKSLFTFGNNKNSATLPFKTRSDLDGNKFGISTGTATAPKRKQPSSTLDASKGLTSNLLTTGQSIIRPSANNGLSTNTALVGSGFGSGSTLGNNGFGSNSVPGGNSMNAGLTLIGTGLNAGNPLGSNTLNVGSNLGSTNTINAGNSLPGNGLNMENTPSVGLTTGNTFGGSTIPVGALTGNVNNNNNNNVFGNPSNPSSPAYTLQTTTTPTPIFGQTVQKENMWSMNNPANSSLTMANTAPKDPAPFSFGSTVPYNASNSTPTFGQNNQPPTNVFGVNQNQSTPNSETMFSMTARNMPASNIFGSPPSTNNQTPAPNIFGTPNMGVAPTFGTPNASIPSFEAASLTPASAPTFKFGAPQTTGIFGFGQQQLSQPTGVYNFGTAGSVQQVQFNMGTAPATTGRRLRKAVRRTNQR